MEMYNPYRTTLYAIVAVIVLICCSIIFIPPLLNAISRGDSVAQKELSCVALKSTDLIGTNYQNRGFTTNCTEYLALDATPYKCYQILFSTDSKQVLVNAIWEFSDENVDEIRNAYAVLISQKPENSFSWETGLVANIFMAEESVRSRLELERPSYVDLMDASQYIFAESVYWRYRKWVVRLTSLENEGPYSNDLVNLANAIQSRLVDELACASQ